MPSLAPERVLELLQAQNFNELRGTSEDERVECKSAPYRLQEESQRIELAKDIAGLANADGGIILIGARTERDAHTRQDIIRDISPIERALVDDEQHQSIVATAIYPIPEGIELRWFQSAADGTRGVMAIVVPAQTGKPYFVVRTLTTEGRRVEVLVGYFERRRAGIQHMTVHRLQSLLRDGLRYDDTLRERFEQIERRLADADRPFDVREAGEPAPVERARERIDEAIAAADLTDGPVYVLSAHPTSRVNMRGLVERRDADLVRLLENPPQLRQMGFDLNTGVEARLTRGELRRSHLAGWKTLDLWRDGTLVFAAAGNEDYLTWGREHPHRINPLVLAESTYLFADLARRVYAFADPPLARVEFRLEVRNMLTDAGPVVLVPYQLGAVGAMHEWNQHPAPAASREVRATHSPDADPGVVAFSLLRELYFWFGFTEEHIPYVRREGEQNRINPELFVPRQ